MSKDFIEQLADLPVTECDLVTPYDEPFEMGELVDVGDPLKVSFVTGNPSRPSETTPPARPRK